MLIGLCLKNIEILTTTDNISNILIFRSWLLYFDLPQRAKHNFNALSSSILTKLLLEQIYTDCLKKQDDKNVLWFFRYLEVSSNWYILIIS